MSDTEDIEDIREQKLEELQRDAGGGPGGETHDEPVHLGETGDFQAFVRDHDLVLVDFHAEWCGPCQMLEPIVEDVAADTPATVLKVDIDDHQQLAGEMGIRGVPTLVLYESGEVAERLVGMQDEETLTGLIDRFA